MPHMAVTFVGWHVYTQVFLGVRGNTLWCPRTKGTAVNEWVNSFVDFGLIPWRFSHKFVKTDLYPLSLMSLRNAVCSNGCGPIIGRCFGACNGTSCADIISLTEKFLMARNFFRMFTENNPTRGTRKNIIMPDVKRLRNYGIAIMYHTVNSYYVHTLVFIGCYFMC